MPKPADLLRLAALALAFAALLACGDAPSSDPALVGRWVSEPSLSQLGRIVLTYEFGEVGVASMSGKLVDAQRVADQMGHEVEFGMELVGRYEARDGTIELTLTGRGFLGSEQTEEAPYVQKVTYRFDGEVLVLQDPDGETWRLHRK